MRRQRTNEPWWRTADPEPGRNLGFTANAAQAPNLEGVAVALAQSGIVVSGSGQGSSATGFVTEDSVRLNLFHINRWELRGTVIGNAMSGAARWGDGNAPITVDGGTWMAVRQ
ncbi:MAG TPA: hypothetical protein VF981_15970 [Gemmatimonadaceae bacterium]